MTQENVTPTANHLFDANLFDIGGPIRMNYSRSSITGAPLMSYKDAELDLNFRGDEITRTTSPMGELVTVTLLTVPDALTRIMTVVIPTIKLRAGGQADFSTFAIETTDHSGGFVPPPGPAGVLQTHQIHQLSGRAQHVDF